MNKRKIVSILLLITGLILSVTFILKIEFPQSFEPYFKREYYNKFGALAISLELIFASYYLLTEHKKTNLALAIFGFTALLDPIFNIIGLFKSIVPIYGTIILTICAIVSLYLAFANTFKLKPLSYLATILSIVLSVIIEFFFNYFQ
ncbi:hypothetical protein KO506_00030 [Polaribacter vadi]|uniref:hypothetical protein n=1 Tax=Polaribacter TaxID=52959 RepID=UPI001C0A6678|nr:MULTISPECIES: hypothetical protein [Polaribacter]MBU3009787.1 hypothetical protein [Polaribacter vadi]MDO6739592.1 hypothetical protein [Polaribacter sp. 1_MG-2023]